jgi:coatomer subunit beta'
MMMFWSLYVKWIQGREIFEGLFLLYSVQTGSWAGDCFIYTCSANRLNYLVGGKPSTISHFDKPMFLLGFIPRDNRVYVCDKNMNISSYSLPLIVIDYQSNVLRGDLEAGSF